SVLAAPRSAYESDGVEIEEDRDRAPLHGRHRVENVRLAERQLDGLAPIGVLADQVSEIGRRAMGRRDREQHVASLSTRTTRPSRAPCQALGEISITVHPRPAADQSDLLRW